MTRVCIFGLGEAGSHISRDLAAAGAAVHAFDPAPVTTPEGVVRETSARNAVSGADVVIALTAAADAVTALRQALAEMPDGAHYADCATAHPDLKRELSSIAAGGGLSFTDVALMGTVPGSGAGTPALASGRDAATLASALSPFGMNLRVVGSEPGEAATHKLLRSIVIKGLAASVIEAMTAAAASGLRDDVWHEVVGQLTRADESFVRRIVEGTGTHAARRRDEMEAAADLVESLGLDAIMSRATVASLERAMAVGTPSLPGANR